MEQALIAVAALIVGAGIGFAVRARVGAGRIAEAERQAARILSDAEGRAEAQVKEARVTAPRGGRYRSAPSRSASWATAGPSWPRPRSVSAPATR